jgi:hypothetical protein
MSRGFDGLEIDDFHGPERDASRAPESNNRAGWDTVRRLERIRGEEKRADQRDREARGAAGGNRPRLPREERVQLVLDRTSRMNYVDRNRTHLSGSTEGRHRKPLCLSPFVPTRKKKLLRRAGKS